MLKAVADAIDKKFRGCTMCHGTGWVLEDNHAEGPLMLELLPCLLPDCRFSGRPVKILSVNMLGHRSVVRHPKDGYVMSLKEGVTNG